MSWWRALALIAGGGCFAWLALHYGDELFAALARADPWYFVAYLMVAVLVRAGYVLRWGAIARALPTSGSWRRLAAARLAADAVGSVSPAGRLSADPLRVVLTLGNGERSSRVAAGVALDRVVETFGNSFAAMAYIAVFWATRTGEREVLSGLAIAMTAGFVGLAGSLLLLAKGQRPLAPVYRLVDSSGARWLRRVMVSVRRAERHVRDLVRLRPGLALAAIAGSLLIEALTVVEYCLLFRAFGASVDLPMVLLSMLVGGVARAAPTPGGLGAFEAGQVAAFGAALGQAELGFTVSVITRLHELLWIGIGWAVLLAVGAGRAGLRYGLVAGKATAR